MTRPLLALLLAACSARTATPDAAVTDDARSIDAAAPAALADLPASTWTFVRVPGAVCGDGSAAGIGVFPRAGATGVLIVIAGGGACWDADTCFARETAVHVSEPYTDAMFAAERAPITAAGWDGTSPANPFLASHIVYVPYCTGDIHGGDAVQTYGPGQTVHHRGGHDMALYLDAMRTAWPALDDVRVVGFSAGGFGAQMNWDRFADAWPSADLAILADCAPLAELDAPRYAAWRASWDLRAPAGCTACATSFSAYDEHLDAAYPATRFGLLATTRDRILTEFWGAPPDYSARVDALLDLVDDNDTTRFFVVDSDQHVILGDALTLRSADGTLLVDWVSGWLEGDETRWHDTRP